MAVRLRFSLSGQRHNRLFRLVAIQNRARRDAKPIETLGVFNPHLKPGETTRTIEWSKDRIQYWLQQGAQPTPSVSKLLTLGGILPHSRSSQSQPEPASEQP